MWWLPPPGDALTSGPLKSTSTYNHNTHPQCSPCSGQGPSPRGSARHHAPGSRPAAGAAGAVVGGLSSRRASRLAMLLSSPAGQRAARSTRIPSAAAPGPTEHPLILPQPTLAQATTNRLPAGSFLLLGERKAVPSWLPLPHRGCPCQPRTSTQPTCAAAASASSGGRSLRGCTTRRTPMRS